MRGQRLDQSLADVIVEFGEDLAAHQVRDRLGQRHALVGIDQFEQIGDVGRVQRLDQRVDFVDLAGFQRRAHPAHEVTLQMIVRIKALAFARTCLAQRNGDVALVVKAIVFIGGGGDRLGMHRPGLGGDAANATG